MIPRMGKPVTSAVRRRWTLWHLVKITKKEKQCTIKYCHKCLLNRYGEKAEEVAVLEDWFCPKCKGICNCSFCRKKLGQQPTGILSYTAKSTGFASVSEMLLVKGPDVQSAKKSTHDNPMKKGRKTLVKILI
ncbi:cell division cycle-associated protein 7-like [Impatiens glandulifera]|uniref:cell division cycle-associated protein 7-like n=1 Tax=Impatiens glandulifera TaxID=253017 RepID=UPI001FB0C68D|nr:cell division cycle-associated protein 7-like [Impatiens glandulifera]